MLSTCAQSFYCSRCSKYIGPTGKRIPYSNTENVIVWVVCDWCLAREAKGKAEQERLEELWALRQCAAPGCTVVFTPTRAAQRFHDDRCRARAHRLGKKRVAR